MRLERIYASKLYLTSSRKDRIHAAINNPVNAPLVQQLAEYLDPQAQDELKRAKATLTKDIPETSEAAGAPASADHESSFAPPMGGGGAPSHSSFSGDPMADFGDDELADIELPEDEDAGEVPVEDLEITEDVPEEVVESVTQEGKPITSATVIAWNSLDDVASECETIKGTLNAREDTKGVIRLEVKDSELWIYFNDDSNLNDKMIEVIFVLNSTGYTYLKFNRLARSNNAIVFDITLNVNDQIKSTKEVQEDK